MLEGPARVARPDKLDELLQPQLELEWGFLLAQGLFVVCAPGEGGGWVAVCEGGSDGCCCCEDADVDEGFDVAGVGEGGGGGGVGGADEVVDDEAIEAGAGPGGVFGG